MRIRDPQRSTVSEIYGAGYMSMLSRWTEQSRPPEPVPQSCSYCNARVEGERCHNCGAPAELSTFSHLAAAVSNIY